MADRRRELAAVVGFGVLGVGLLVILFSSDFYALDSAKERAATFGQDKTPSDP